MCSPNVDSAAADDETLDLEREADVNAETSGCPPYPHSAGCGGCTVLPS